MTLARKNRAVILRRDEAWVTSALLVLALGQAVPATGQGSIDRAAVPEGFEVPAQVLEDIDFRMVGPARGGRVTTVTGIPDEPHVFYLGSTGGGVWKTVNAGVSWTNLSDDDFAVGSIGAVAVAPSDPNVIYVGTGSACPRGNISVGNGVYRSTDGGRSWAHAGLEAAGLIGRIVVDPDDPDRALVAVLGQIFGRSPERGVYRTEDGGSTWSAVLQISDATGAVELAMNPANPRELFAAMWQAERKPWTLIDGGAEGGLYRTRDGGDSWELLRGGLPEASDDTPLGRIGVSIAASDPRRVYALVTAAEERGGLYRSDDGGDTWTRVNGDRRFRARGWYYSHVVADPHGSGHGVRPQRAVPEVGGRRQVLPVRPRSARRQPRPVDQSERLPNHGGGERRGRGGHARRGRELVLHSQPAHRRVLSAHRG